MTKKSIAIIGGGPAALMLACELNTNKYSVSIYEKNNALARKFLVAGNGGFNLTHSEELPQFVERYYPSNFIKTFINHFSNEKFRLWLKEKGIETYVGTSKRVFPVKGIKPIEVLSAIERNLSNVAVHYNYEWIGWKENQISFKAEKNQTIYLNPDIVVFALGGASWKVTGSNGNWTDFFLEKGIITKPFFPSNCAYKVNWHFEIIEKHSGKALKNCVFSCESTGKIGEAVVTKFGIEGSGVYFLSPEIRNQLLTDNNKKATLFIDFKPNFSLDEIKQMIENKGKHSIKEVLEKQLKLTSLQIELLKHCTTKQEFTNADLLSVNIKKFKVSIEDFAPIDDAISTVGGIALEEINQNLEIKKMPRHYCIGEMLDWDAPTGGYLLQACFSMGKFLADKLNKD